jgi:hypothetical protein
MNTAMSDNIFRRQLRRFAKDGLRTFRRQLRRLVTDPRAAVAYARYRAAVRRHDWARLRAMLPELSRVALRSQDRRFLTELGQAAMRLDDPQRGVELQHAARESFATAWNGESFDGTLVVRMMDTQSQGVAVGVPLCGYVRLAATRAARTILVVERRMVPLFQRTLPEVTVVAYDTDLTPHIRGPAYDVDIHNLRVVFGFDKAAIARHHVPLAADVAEARVLRERYARGRDLPLIGISWWSSHYGKDLPSLRDWAQLIETLPAQYVSLQYGDVADDIAILRGNNPDRLLVDETVDQMRDMNRFASQIAALDLVISISNSGAHLAGALGQKMILVRDDLFRRIWPYLSRDVPWYPRTVVIGKDGRPWDAAFEDIRATARGLLAQRERS